jgi:hypothetical protein
MNFLLVMFWSWRRDLNPRPADYKSAALPTELRQPVGKTDNLPEEFQTCNKEFFTNCHIFQALRLC